MNRKLKLILSVLLLISIIGFYFALNQNVDVENSKSIKNFLEGNGFSNILWYIALVAIITSMPPLPSFILDIVGGAIWGLFPGVIYSFIGHLIGASISFFIAKYLGRELLEKVFGNKLKKLNEIEENKLFFVLLVARAVPVFHFGLLSYAAGLTHMRYRWFMLANSLAFIPILFYSNFGHAIIFGDITKIGISLFLIIVLIYIARKIKSN